MPERRATRRSGPAATVRSCGWRRCRSATPISFPIDLEELVRYLIESSLPTHASPQCLSACAYFGLVLCGLIHGIDRQEVLAGNWEPLLRLKQIHALHPEVEEVAAGSFRHKQPPEIVGSGYVVKSLEAALWAFHDAKDFREAVLRAVNLGDDADTTGAVCGQLAGAYWGESGIPQEWRDGLARPGYDSREGRGMFWKQWTNTKITQQRLDLPMKRTSQVSFGIIIARAPSIPKPFVSRNEP